jgi:hypothetical protein
MARPALEVADIFRDHGPAWREANRGHVSLDQSKVMSAIERCRTAALGGHVARCENAACGHTEIAYNSCLMGDFRNGELAVANLAFFKCFGVDSPSFCSPLQRLCAEIGQREIALRGAQDLRCASSWIGREKTCDHRNLPAPRIRRKARSH